MPTHRTDKPSAKPDAKTKGRRRRRRPHKKKQQAETHAARVLAPAPALERDAPPAEQPLSPQEREQAQQQLRFLAKHRRLLRLRLNAQEDLLVNGAREPEHRGVLRHLFGKVDRACVDKALTRLPSEADRLPLLEGLVSLSPDIHVLLLYLESLATHAPGPAAAAALSMALDSIRFDAVTEGQMARLLDLIAQTFDQEERPQLLLRLLANPSFCEAFDAALTRLPTGLADLLSPVRAAHRALFSQHPSAEDPALLTRGLDLLLASQGKAWASYAPRVRERLFSLACDLLPFGPQLDRSLAALMESFPTNSRARSRLGMQRARKLLEAHQDDHAADLLRALKDSHPSFELPRRWL